MAYDSMKLSVLGYADSFTFWVYRTDDSRADMLRPGYIKRDNRIHPQPKVGDQITILSTAEPFPLLAVVSGTDPVRLAIARLQFDVADAEVEAA